MNSVLLIDNPVRKQTRSTDFLLNLFSEWQIAVDYEDKYPELLSSTDFDLVLFWQGLPDLKRIPLLEAHNTVLVPMWDQVELVVDRDWFELRRLRFWSFSEALHRRLLTVGLDSFLIQYFPPLAWVEISEKENACLFWRRQERPDLITLETVLFRQSFDTIYFRDDTMEDGLAATIDTPGKVVFFGRTSDRQNYLDLLARCRVQFASRYSEGIGLSFLEAMARGVWVVAANHPTLNEYIRPGLNGSLYNPEMASPCEPIDWSAAERTLRVEAERLRARYVNRLPLLWQFLKKKSPRFHWRSGAGAVLFAVQWVVRRMKWLMSRFR